MFREVKGEDVFDAFLVLVALVAGLTCFFAK